MFHSSNIRGLRNSKPVVNRKDWEKRTRSATLAGLSLQNSEYLRVKFHLRFNRYDLNQIHISVQTKQHFKIFLKLSEWKKKQDKKKKNSA